MRGPLVLIAVVLLGAGGFLALQSRPAAQPAPPAQAAAPQASPASQPVPTAADGAPVATAGLPTVKIFKSPTCGCCTKWAEHLQAEGFPVELVDTDDLMTVKAALGVPSDMGSCHTAQVGEYVVEGHVPATDIKDLLRDAPEDTRGLAVPGMPVGSPGMEVPGRPADRYDVVAFTDDGRRRVYRSH
jgi:hypothetical protein